MKSLVLSLVATLAVAGRAAQVLELDRTHPL